MHRKTLLRASVRKISCSRTCNSTKKLTLRQLNTPIKAPYIWYLIQGMRGLLESPSPIYGSRRGLTGMPLLILATTGDWHYGVWVVLGMFAQPEFIANRKLLQMLKDAVKHKTFLTVSIALSKISNSKSQLSGSMLKVRSVWNRTTANWQHWLNCQDMTIREKIYGP